MKKFVKENLLYLLEIFLSFFIAVLIYKIGYIYIDCKYLSKIYYFLLLFIIAILLFVIVRLFKKNKKNLEKLFLVLVIPLGIFYTILLLPNYAPDESAHFARAYSVSQGNIKVRTNSKKEYQLYAPKFLNKYEAKGVSNYSDLHKIMGMKTDYSDKVISNNRNAAGYYFAMYIVPSIGIKIGQIFNLNIYITYYIAKMFNMIFFIIVGYFIIKKIPIGKLIMFAYLLNPMILSQAASVSADNFINILAISFFTYILCLKFEKKKIQRKNIIILLLMAINLLWCKYVYAILIILLLLLININYEKFIHSKLFKYLKFIIPITCGLIFLILFLYYIGPTYLWNKGGNEIYRPLYGGSGYRNTHDQLKFILDNPYRYVLVLWTTFTCKTEFYMNSFAGQYLGWLNINGLHLSTICFWALLFLAPFIEKKKFELNKFEKIICNFVVFISYNLILAGLYFLWTDVGEMAISGVQGRYFLPIFFIPFITFCNKKKNIKIKNYTEIYFVLLLLINCYSIYTIFRFFL